MEFLIAMLILGLRLLADKGREIEAREAGRRMREKLAKEREERLEQLRERGVIK